MGGIGRRFKKQNFSTIKPLIMIENKVSWKSQLKSCPTQIIK